MVWEQSFDSIVLFRKHFLWNQLEWKYELVELEFLLAWGFHVNELNICIWKQWGFAVSWALNKSCIFEHLIKFFDWYSLRFVWSVLFKNCEKLILKRKFFWFFFLFFIIFKLRFFCNWLIRWDCSWRSILCSDELKNIV